MVLDYYGSSSVNDQILNTQYVKLLVFSSVYGMLHRYKIKTRLAEGIHFMCEKNNEKKYSHYYYELNLKKLNNQLVLIL